MSLLQKKQEEIYVQCVIWEAAAWTNSKTKQGFIIFVGKKPGHVYNWYWLKSLKYLRPKQEEIRQRQDFIHYARDVRLLCHCRSSRWQQ